MSVKPRSTAPFRTPAKPLAFARLNDSNSTDFASPLASITLPSDLFSVAVPVA